MNELLRLSTEDGTPYTVMVRRNRVGKYAFLIGGQLEADSTFEFDTPQEAIEAAKKHAEEEASWWGDTQE